MEKARASESHRLIGGELCLDFANTLNGHTRSDPHEYLHDCRDLLLWGRHAGVLTEQAADVLLREATLHPEQAQSAYRSGLELRETIFCIFSSLSHNGRVEPRDRQRLNAAWQAGRSHLRLVQAAGGFSLDWDDEPCLERVARLAVDSAVNLLISPQVLQVRSCSGAGCDWLFLDASRNHLRRWCSMDECGNRAKMQRRSQRAYPKNRRIEF